MMMRTFTAIGLVGAFILTMSSAKATENKQLTPQEKEMAHKMMLLQQAMPPEAKDVIKGNIGPTLHAVTTLKKFMCPTAAELQHSVKRPGTQINDYEINGIHFTTTVDEIPANSKIEEVVVSFKLPENEISRIGCLYEKVNGLVYVDFGASGFDGAQVTISPNDMQLSHKDIDEEERHESFNKNIEFTVHPKK